jgi:hypothetical protein
MLKLNKNKLPLKYLIDFTVLNPSIEDLLFEIITIMIDKNEDTINNWEITNKTKTRINKDINDDINLLIEKGYLMKDKYKKFKLLNNPFI